MRTAVLTLLWPVSGVAFAVIPVGILAVSFSLAIGDDFKESLGFAILFVGLFLSFFATAAPAVLLGCLAWPRLARRWPSVESLGVMQAIFLGSGALASFALWATGPVPPGYLVAMFEAVWLPLAIPRLVVPGFRAGSFLDRAA